MWKTSFKNLWLHNLTKRCFYPKIKGFYDRSCNHWSTDRICKNAFYDIMERKSYKTRENSFITEQITVRKTSWCTNKKCFCKKYKNENYHNDNPISCATLVFAYFGCKLHASKYRRRLQAVLYVFATLLCTLKVNIFLSKVMDIMYLWMVCKVQPKIVLLSQKLIDANDTFCASLSFQL